MAKPSKSVAATGSCIRTFTPATPHPAAGARLDTFFNHHGSRKNVKPAPERQHLVKHERQLTAAVFHRS